MWTEKIKQELQYHHETTTGVNTLTTDQHEKKSFFCSFEQWAAGL